ncbi:MAG: DUF4405 domain-containing protein [Nanoarchaeota archaeon]|nr:DUF4405 domain-containing protein [Nanoarchaeota archaeon]MBU1027723.1 DUF4405 domain-containing protein [Nanoarchaeota archaeon]
MNKNQVKFTIDLLMFIDFLLIAISGFILWLVLPRGGGKLGNLFIFLREDWLFIHHWTSVLLIILIIIHLLLNWIWIKNMFLRICIGQII